MFFRASLLLARKDPGTFRENVKARFVVQDHEDSTKSSLDHGTSFARSQATRMFIGIAAIFRYRIFN